MTSEQRKTLNKKEARLGGGLRSSYFFFAGGRLCSLTVLAGCFSAKRSVTNRPVSALRWSAGPFVFDMRWLQLAISIREAALPTIGRALFRGATDSNPTSAVIGGDRSGSAGLRAPTGQSGVGCKHEPTRACVQCPWLISSEGVRDARSRQGLPC